MRTKGLWLIPLLALAFLAQLPVSVVHAADPTITHTQNVSVGKIAVTVTVSSGDALFIGFANTSPTGGCNSSPPYTNLDTFGTSFTCLRFIQESSVTNQWIYYLYGFPTSTGSDTINFTTTTVPVCPATGYCFLWVVDKQNVKNQAPRASGAGQSAGTMGTIMTTGSLTPASTDFVLAFGSTRIGTNAVYSTGTGFDSAFSDCYLSSGNCAGGEYAASWGGAGGSTTCPINLSASEDWVEICASFATLPTTNAVVLVTAPCNFNQLQCWWYPMFFMLTFSGLFLFVAGVSKTPPKQAMHLFLSGLTFGSIVAVIFGILTIAVPLVLLILNTLYVVRFRGR